MFKEKDKINTPKGTGEIIGFKKSSYSKSVLFLIVKLDSTGEEYFCPVDSANKL